MGRTLLILVLAAAIALVIWSLMRRRPRDDPSDDADEETAARRALDVTDEVPALAAPAAGAFTERDAFRKLHELAFGGTPVGRGVPPSHAPIVAAVSSVLGSDVVQARYAPRRPLLLPQIMRAVNDGDTSARELANLISQDPALAGNLLQFANSPLYRVNTQAVESVDRAVTMLGFDGIRSLIATALVQPVFRVTAVEFAGYPQTIWEHTFRSASAAEAHAAIVEDSDPFAAQLIALVMGLGAIIVFRATLDEYATRKQQPEATVIASLLDAHTARVARRIADDWELSGRVLAALEDQVPELGMNKPASLGRSLRFGRLVGALAQLQAQGLIDEAAVKSAIAEHGGAGAHFDRIWARQAQLRTQ